MKSYTLPLEELPLFFNFVREKFGNQNLFFTILPFKGEKVFEPSTFARDNFEHFEPWITFVTAKLASGNLDGISVVIRRFLKEKAINGYPLKEIYHLLFAVKRRKTLRRKGFMKEVKVTLEVITFSAQETEENQNTDAFTGRKLKPPPDEMYISSQILWENFLKWKNS